jgi:ferrous iron transport protein B
VKKYDNFFDALNEALSKKTILDVSSLEEKYSKLEGYEELKAEIPENLIQGCSSTWLAVKTIEGDKVVKAKIENKVTVDSLVRFNSHAARFDKGALLTGECKFSWIDELLSDSVNKVTQTVKTSKLDKALTNKTWGKAVVVLIVIGGLLLSFIPAVPIMLLGNVFTALAVPVREALTAANASPIITGIVCDVILQSLANIVKMLGFAFGINLVFGMFEESGLMARISYVFDNTMSKMGLQGKSIMPFLVSFGCTIGGASSSRVIDNWNQKVLTIALAWAVPCGAAWAIIPMLAANFFGGYAVLVIIAILLVMLLHIWITAKIFGRKLVKKEDRYGIIMELPPYHKAHWKYIIKEAWIKCLDMFLRALKTVTLVSVIFWVFSYSPSGNVESSLLYKVGTFIEPVTKFFGMGWQTFMAFISAAFAKEAVLGTLNAVFAGQSNVADVAFNASSIGVDREALSTVMTQTISKAEALAFMFACTFSVPCLMALSTTYKESHSFAWTAKTAGFYVGASLILSCIVYHIAALFLG